MLLSYVYMYTVYVYSFANRSDIQLPNPALILFLDISLNDLTALEQHQLVSFSQLRYLNASLNRIEK